MYYVITHSHNRSSSSIIPRLVLGAFYRSHHCSIHLDNGFEMCYYKMLFMTILPKVLPNKCGPNQSTRQTVNRRTHHHSQPQLQKTQRKRPRRRSKIKLVSRPCNIRFQYSILIMSQNVTQTSWKQPLRRLCALPTLGGLSYLSSIHTLPAIPNVPPRLQTSSSFLTSTSSPTAPRIVTDTPNAFFSSYPTVISTIPEIGPRSGHVITILGRLPLKNARSVPNKSSVSFPDGINTFTGILRGANLPSH